MAEIPEEIQDLIESFRKAEKVEIYSEKIEKFEEAFEVSKETLEDLPKFEEKIKKVRVAYARGLLNTLKNTRPDLDQVTAIRYILLFMTTLREETRAIIHDDFSLKEYLVELASLWSENTQPELRSVISVELGF